MVLRTKQMRVSPVVFNQSASLCSAAVTISALAGPDGRLVLGFTWQEGISEANLVEQIKGYVEGLVEIGDDKPQPEDFDNPDAFNLHPEWGYIHNKALSLCFNIH